MVGQTTDCDSGDLGFGVIPLVSDKEITLFIVINSGQRLTGIIVKVTSKS